jgi:hypothetical protein
VVYAGVVGAEIGTPEVGKRLLVEDIELVTVKERVNQGEGKKWVVVNVLYLYAKEGKGKQFSRACESAFSGRVGTRSRGRPLSTSPKQNTLCTGYRIISDDRVPRHTNRVIIKTKRASRE